MTNLRVFEDRWKRRLIEISAPDSVLSRALFLPVLRDDQQLSKLLNPSEVVEVIFQNELLRIPFLLTLSRERVRISRYSLLGVLEETDSIKILNHLLDVLAWP
jgi:hypothetical protein